MFVLVSLLSNYVIEGLSYLFVVIIFLIMGVLVVVQWSVDIGANSIVKYGVPSIET